MTERYDDLPGLSWSLVKQIEHSPAMFAWTRSHPRPDTDVFRRGRLLHCLVLEPNTEPDRYAVWKGRRQGKAWDAFAEANAGKTIVTESQRDAAGDMARAVLAVWCVGSFDRVEVPLAWEADGMSLRGRADAVGRAIVEIKSTRSTAHDSFTRQSWALGYHCQLAHYRAGVFAMQRRTLPCRIVAVEATPPYDVAVFDVEDELLAEGAEHVARLIERIRVCERSGLWPRRYEMAMPLGKPAWAEARDEADLSGLDIERAEGGDDEL
jgi:hypothetical protein